MKENLFQEMSLTECSNLYGGDWVRNAGHNVRAFLNNAYDFLTSVDPAMSETLMNCI